MKHDATGSSKTARASGWILGGTLVVGTAIVLALTAQRRAHFYEQKWREAQSERFGEVGTDTQKQIAASNDADAVESQNTGPEQQRRNNSFTWNNRAGSELDFLSPEKRALLAILPTYDLRRDKLLNPPGGILLKDDLEKIRLLEAERRNLLASVLTPAELEHFELQVHPVAETMRRDLAAFQPNEDEFRQIFGIRKEAEESVRDLQLEARANPGASQSGLAMAAMIEGAESKIQETLGPQRYAEYKRSQDPEFVVLHRISEQVGLPDASAIQAYEARKVSEQAYSQLQAELKQQGNPTPALEQWFEGRLISIQEAEQTALKRALGSKGLEEFQKNNLEAVRTPPLAPGR